MEAFKCNDNYLPASVWTVKDLENLVAAMTCIHDNNRGQLPHQTFLYLCAYCIFPMDPTGRGSESSAGGLECRPLERYDAWNICTTNWMLR